MAANFLNEIPKDIKLSVIVVVGKYRTGTPLILI